MRGANVRGGLGLLFERSVLRARGQRVHGCLQVERDRVLLRQRVLRRSVRPLVEPLHQLCERRPELRLEHHLLQRHVYGGAVRELSGATRAVHGERRLLHGLLLQQHDPHLFPSPR